MNDNDIPFYSIESLKSTGFESKDFDFFRFEYFARDIQHLMTPHRHHFYTFLLITEGGGNHSIDFEAYDLKRNRLFLISPGQVHAWNELRKVKGFVVLFNDNLMTLSKGRKMMSAWPLFRSHQRCFFDLGKDEFTIWVDELIAMEQETFAKDEFTRDALFYSISALLVRASRLYKKSLKSPHPVKLDLLFVFQNLIEKKFLTFKTPNAYAAKMNITANHLNAVVKKKSGKSAGELIRQRILLEAKRLLAHTQLSISEISYQLNFEDNSYFGKFFKKYNGTTPALFRQKQQKK